MNTRQQAQLQGEHPRLHRPVLSGKDSRMYVAGIDLAGKAEEVEDAALRAARPREDSTVVTIGELDFSVCTELVPLPQVNIVEHYCWTGMPHVAQYPQLLDVLRNVWHVRRAVVDATGVGAAVASFLSGALGTSVVLPFLFTQPSKSRLGFELLAAINSGRVKLYAQDGSEEYREFWFQINSARSNFRPNQTMNFYVDPIVGHDDYLSSLALLVEAAQYTPRAAKGRVRTA